MTLNNEQLRLGIIEKLKECNAYIDNELPDYIMVMLVNKKTFHQISSDLQLFLGEHTAPFIEWLQQSVTTGSLTASKKNKAPDQGGLQTSEGKEQLQTTKKDLKPSVKEVSPAVEKNSNKEKRSSSGIKRRRSEDELELHPAIDWEEEGEGGGKEREGVERPTSRKLSRRSGESKSSQRSGVEEAKVIRTSSGERDGEGREKRRGGKKSDVEERGEKGDDEPAVKHTRTLKLSKSEDLRVLIARKKGERSAPPSYLSSRRHSHSGSEGESAGEEEGEGERRGGLSSVVKVPERTHLSIEGGGRLLQRAIRGLVPKQRSERPRRGGREERGQRGGREGLGGEGSGKKRKVRDSQTAGELVPVIKRAAVEVEEDVDIAEEEVEKEAEEQQLAVTEEEDISPLSADEESAAEKGDHSPITTSSGDDTTRKVELAVITALRKVLPNKKDLTDLRQLINRQRGKTEADTQPGTQFVVTMDGVNERYGVREERGDKEEVREGGEKREKIGGHVTQGEGDPPSRGAGMPERCRFWPNCKKGDSCPFHHPSAQCRMFPNCKYGNKCLFIHPQCKFDSRCTRSDCPYLHTAPRHVLPRALPSPPIFPTPAFSPVMKFPPPASAMWSHKSRFPRKSALTWTPSKTATHHISQRRFAVPDEETTSMPVK